MLDAPRTVTTLLETARDRFLADVSRGLAESPKTIHPKYFYDRQGSILFDAICDLPEYYLTRTETTILEQHIGDIAASLPARVRVVEPGAGSGRKTRLLLRALGDRCAEYVPTDISREHLAEAAARIAADLPWLRVRPACADFMTDLPEAVAGPTRTLVFFPGSTLGNAEPREAERLIARFRRCVGPEGGVLLGVDLKKDPAVLHAAYNDARGVTAAFNQNLLVRMNRELGANFDVARFAHYAFYNPAQGCIEMHLVSTRAQRVQLGGREIRFAEGESIRTERSYKYDLGSLTRLAQASGFALAKTWLDDASRFAVVLLRPRPDCD